MKLNDEIPVYVLKYTCMYGGNGTVHTRHTHMDRVI